MEIYAPGFLAHKYFSGNGVPQDYVEAYRWFSRAVELQGKNATDALFWLGYMQENGYGVEVNYQKAIYYYKQVADGRKPGISKTLDSVAMIPDCMFRLGYLYQHGIGVNVDYTLATHYYENAMQYDHASAIFNYGCMVFDGQGCTVSQSEALRLWYKAANVATYDDEPVVSGIIQAMFNIGVCKEMGYGCLVDYDEALMWYKKAMGYGHERAESAIENLNKKILESQKHSSFISRLKRLFS